VYRRLIRPGAADAELVRVGRYASLVALVLAGLIAPSVERLGGIFRYFQTGVTYLATPFISVIILGLLWRRANYAGALFGLIGGIAIQTGVALGAPALGYPLHWLYLAFIAQVLTMVGIAIVSLCTAPLPPGPWESFLWSPRLLFRYDEGARRPWYARPMLWYGIFAAIWIHLYWRFW
jgi:solute:Na+ symporter, SSS family